MNAIEELIDLASRLTPSGVIGDGMVARFHSLAKEAQRELSVSAKPTSTGTPS